MTLPKPDQTNARVIDPDSPEWPHGAFAVLNEHRDPAVRAPTRLWVRGEANLAELTARSITVDGSRAATASGEFHAADLAYALAANAVTVVGSGAYGVAAAAHRGALAGNGRTVVVFAGGTAVDHPEGHAMLFRGITANGGLVISPHPPHTPPSRQGFAYRAALLAALTRGTVQVEATQRSAELLIASRARELGRPVMAMPGPINSIHAAGCHDLIRAGHATLVSSVEQVLSDTGLDPSPGCARS